MSKLSGRRRAATGGLMAVALGMGAVGVAPVAAKTAGRADSGTSYVAVTHQAGSAFLAAGNTADSVFGAGAVTYKIKAGTGTKPGTIRITAHVTVFTSTGTLSGAATGTETTKADGSVTLAGKITLTKGTGAQKGHSLIDTFSGTGKAALGPFVFHTRGTYK